MKGFIEDETLPQYTVENVSRNPFVRVEYEQALAIGGIGECLAATASKNWGDGPHVLPLEVDDYFYADRITYVFKAGSLYNRRFHQRRRMKKLLGKNRALVGDAKSSTKRDFLKQLTFEQARLIQRVFKISPGRFWQAASGARFIELPPEFIQKELDFGE